MKGLWLRDITDKNGNIIRYHYDVTGRLTSLVEGSGRTLRISYVSGKNLIEAISLNSSGYCFRYRYDEFDNLIEVSDPLGHRIRYEYSDPNDRHNLTAYIDANNNRTEYAYNTGDQCVRVTDAQGNDSAYQYNAALGITTVTDARGRVSVYVHRHRLITKIIDSDGRQTSYTYDQHFFRNSRTDDSGRTTNWTNDRFGNALEIRELDEDGEEKVLSVMTYDELTQRVKTITSLGRQTVFTYDSTGNMVEKNEPGPEGARALTTYTLNYSGQVAGITDPSGIQTRFEYDVYGNVVKEISADGHYRQYTYDARNNLLTSGFDEEPPTVYEYDLSNRLIKITHPDGSDESMSYDAHGNLLSRRDANGNISIYEYNNLNQLVKTTDAEGRVTSYRYDAVGNAVETARVYEQRNLTRTRVFDDHFNRVTRITDETGRRTDYSYESVAGVMNGSEFNAKTVYPRTGEALREQYNQYDRRYRLTYSCNALNNGMRFSYDSADNVSGMRTMDDRLIVSYTRDAQTGLPVAEQTAIGTKRYTYNLNSALKTSTDMHGRVSTCSYDNSGRLQRIIYSDNTSLEYTYNQYGMISAMIDPAGTTAYSYDARCRLTQVDGPFAEDTVAYHYDLSGNRRQMTVSGLGTYQYEYDKTNRLTQLINPHAQTTTFTYDAVGRVAQMRQANGVITEWEYYDNDQPRRVSVRTAGGSVLEAYEYIYDGSSRLSEVRAAAGIVTNYTYDAAGRLLSEVQRQAEVVLFSVAYTYDAQGNRLTENRNGQLIAYTYNTANQLIGRSGAGEAITYSYDADGNLVQRLSSVNGAQALNWDVRQRLVASATAQGTTAYLYSGDGRRLRVTTAVGAREYLYDGMLPVAERDAAGTVTADNTWLPTPGGIGGLISRTEGSRTWYYHCNHLGNVTLITDESGGVVQRYRYDGFGRIIEQSGSLSTAYQFQTKETDAGGLVYFGARYYDPQAGRFISPDPLGFKDGANVYAYCANNPVNYADAWGQCRSHFDWSENFWKEFWLEIYKNYRIDLDEAHRMALQELKETATSTDR
ncbi:MAG: hypothetical protein NC924_06315 [Candidatus Omnitrophica bacterium]|nr:hypothetical protein [Candidatus Omnitrophota bacterium]